MQMPLATPHKAEGEPWGLLGPPHGAVLVTKWGDAIAVKKGTDLDWPYGNRAQ